MCWRSLCPCVSVCEHRWFLFQNYRKALLECRFALVSEEVLRASIKRMALLPTIDSIRCAESRWYDPCFEADTEAIMQDGFDVAWWQCVSSPFELGGEGSLTLLLWGVSLIDVL
jgi:hypothetical protein